MLTKVKKDTSGFTIVELLIVIVVIGILAALVINTFSGIQARARDTERKADVNSIHSNLAVYYTDNGYYPTAANLNTTNLSDLDGEALNDPQGNALGATGAQYSYTPSGCSGSQCTGYTLSADLENDGLGGADSDSDTADFTKSG